MTDFYKCTKCGAEIDNSKPFIQCGYGKDCPETDGKGSLLDQMIAETDARIAALSDSEQNKKPKVQ